MIRGDPSGSDRRDHRRIDDEMGEQSELGTLLAGLTTQWVAYSSEGVALRREIIEIARAHGATAEVVVQADGAVLTVREGDQRSTFAVASPQQITRLDRVSDLMDVVERAKKPDADLTELNAELETIASSPPIYPWWARAAGIVLFTVGFAPNVQATWQEVVYAVWTGAIVALLVALSDRFGRVSVLTPFLAATAVSSAVLSVVDADVEGGVLYLMIPALFFFIPGDILSASMFELAAGRITAGSVQLVNAMFTLLLLLVGVLFGATLTGTDLDSLFAPPADAEFPHVVLWLGWVLFAFGFTVAFSVHMADFGWVLLVTLVAFGVQLLGTAAFGELVGTFLAAVVLVLVAAGVDRHGGPPPLVSALSGFFVLTVGALGLEGSTALVSGDDVAGFTDLLKMLIIGLSIAIGLLVGAVIAHRPTD